MGANHKPRDLHISLPWHTPPPREREETFSVVAPSDKMDAWIVSPPLEFFVIEQSIFIASIRPTHPIHPHPYTPTTTAQAPESSQQEDA